MRKPTNIAVSVLFACVLTIASALAAPTTGSYFDSGRIDNYFYPGQVKQSDIVCTRFAVVAADTAIDLGRPCSVISFFPELDDIHINLKNVGAATTSFPKIAKGTAYTYVGPPIRYIRYLGAAATGQLSIIAY